MQIRYIGKRHTVQTLAKSKKGFTLLEIIIGISIITLMGISFLVMFSSAYTAFFTLGNQTKAVNEAQSLIEMYYTDPSTIDESEWQLVDDLNSDLISTYSGYSKFYQVEVKSDYGQDFEKITVVVFYSNNTKRVTLSSFV